MYLLATRSPSNLGHLGRVSRFAAMRPMPTAVRRRTLRGLGDAASTASGIPSWFPIIGGYNTGVVATESNAAAAAEAPDNSPAMQAAVTQAIAAGNDPTTVLNLWQNGADIVQMQLLANGAVTPDQVTAPGSAPLTDAQLTAAFNAANAASPGLLPTGTGIAAWISANWPWLALSGVGTFVLLRELN